jgi:ParB family chromosome partitioning protein
MSTRRNALGRGLDALIPGSGPAVAAVPPPPEPGVRAHEIPVSEIDPNPEQPRRTFDGEEIQHLADSIRRHGVLQPVVVRRSGSRYELVVGERRWRASRVAGRETIPAVVADVDAQDRLEVALIENVQRQDLNPIELAHAFRNLADAGATQDQIGERVGLDRSTVANHLRLLELGRESQEDVEQGRLTVGHAKALLQVSNPERRRHLRDRILKDGLSVRAAEELGRTLAGPVARRAARPRPAPDPELRRLADSLRQRLQTRVRLQGDARRGRIEIEYFGEEDLQRLADLLMGHA